MRKILCICVVFLLATMSSWAQRTVSGRVTDGNGNPVAGASVQVQNTQVGAVTKDNGTFSLTVPANGRNLVVTAVGLASQEIAIGNQTSFVITLRPAAEQSMQEVVVVGYGTQRRADITGSVATVKAAEIENRPFSSVDKALQGQVPGLQSVAASGQPGSSQAILIRGVSS